jgi:hypothetical protein
LSPKLRPRLIGRALLVLLAVSLAGNVILYPRAACPLYETEDLPLIERTLAMAATTERMSPDELRGLSFPIAMHLSGGRTCVEIRNRDDGGSHGACYNRSGTLIEQIDRVNF